MDQQARTNIDPSIERITVGDFAFPLGVVPVEPCAPQPGYTVGFESADGGESESIEEWPDRYVFEAAISAERVEPLCRTLFTLLPGRVYPILDVLSADAYREVDPYIAYDPVGLDTFLAAVRRHQGWLYEDGLVGFGAMTESPFLYIYLDEHKRLTVRSEIAVREEIERIFEAFDLCEQEEEGAASSEALPELGSHEHRCVLEMPEARSELLGPEEVVEELQELWRLRLNIDYDSNFDDEGIPLGITPWRCEARVIDEQDRVGYAEALLFAGSYSEAETLMIEAVEDLAGDLSPADIGLLLADRLLSEQYKIAQQAWSIAVEQDKGHAMQIAGAASNPAKAGVYGVRWMAAGR